MEQELVVRLWVHVPALQTSAVQELPSLAQALPSGMVDQAVVDLEGTHPRHPPVGALSPLAWHLPPMRQLPVEGVWVQVPALQTSAVQESPSPVQAASSARTDQAEVDLDGTHPMQGLDADLSPAA